MTNKQTETKEKDRFSLLEAELIKDLYKEVIHTKNKNEVGLFEIFFGEFDEPENQKKIIALEQLKKKGIVKNYSVEEIEKTFKNPPPEGDYEDTIIIIAKCELKPIKIIEYSKKICKEKEIFLTELAKIFNNLISVIDFYSKNPLTTEDEVNQAYISCTNSLNKLLKNPSLQYFKEKYKKPFTNLFLAEKELEENNASVQAIIKQLSAMLGEVNYKISLCKYFYSGERSWFDFDKVISKIKDDNKNTKETNNSLDFAIYKNVENEFYYGNKKIFNSNDTIYFYIFEFLYEKTDGSASYNEINDYLEKKKPDIPQKDTTQEQSLRISNGIKSLWRYSKLPKKIYGKETISIKRGYGVSLYNPRVK